VSLAEAYARIENGEAWLVGANISPWDTGNRYNHEPKRNRKLLIHRDEIVDLLMKTKAKGLTLVRCACTSRAEAAPSWRSRWPAASTSTTDAGT